MAAIKTHDGVVAVISGIFIAVTNVRSPNAIKLFSIPVSAGDRPNKPEKKKKSDEESSQHDEDSGGKNRALASAFSPRGRYFAACDDHKQLHVFTSQEDEWTLLSSRPLQRRATSVLFTKDESSVLVGDKSGDVYCFPTIADDKELTGADEKVKDAGDGEVRDAVEGQDKDWGEGEVKGQLILGHLSMLLDMCLACGDKYIVTSDRDEKLRISEFPNAYNIHTYCLGHTEFVSCLLYVEELNVLISGSGDCTLRVWSMKGKQLCLAYCVQDTAPSTGWQQSGDQVSSGGVERTMVSEKSDVGGHGVKEERDVRERPAIQNLSYCPRHRLLAVAFYRISEVQVYRLSRDGEEGTVTLTLVHTISLTIPAWDVSFDDNINTLWILAPTSGATLTAYHVGETTGDVQVTEVDEEESGVSQLARTVNSNWDIFLDSLSVPSPVPTLWKIASHDKVTEYQQKKMQRLQGQRGRHKGSNPTSVGNQDKNGAAEQPEKKARVA